MFDYDDDFDLVWDDDNYEELDEQPLTEDEAVFIAWLLALVGSEYDDSE